MKSSGPVGPLTTSVSTSPAPSVCGIQRWGTSSSTYEVFDVSTDSDLTLVVYTTQTGSTSEDALKLLASWTATEAQTGDDFSTRP